MNKRINELAEQAAYETRMSHNNPYWRMQNGIEEDIAWREKFAELLIKECIVVINQSNGVGDDDVIKITEDVQTHFGIK